MAYDGRAVANYFLELAKKDGVPLSHLKLQKLIYFAHGWYLAYYGEPLVENGVQAWQHGPVSPDVYEAFKWFGAKPIDRPATQKIAADNDEGYTRVVVAPPPPSDQQVRQHIERAYRSYRRYSAAKLSAATHIPGSPWAQTTEGLPTRGIRLQMNDEVIKGYFNRALERSQKGATDKAAE